ncbi:MAG: T9SS type A sorting domain-containing protein [Parafilimonas sp.]|nr:T9SS type A sorting domain-containing protein [Parafilimonas sp.]
MNKIFTLQYFNSIYKTLLVAAIVLLLAIIQPANAMAVSATGFNPGGVQTKTVKCYPNPAVSFINFEFPADYISKNYSLQIFSFTGKKMVALNINNAKSTLTFNNDFYRGIYIYQVRDKDGKILETGKFQVNK